MTKYRDEIDNKFKWDLTKIYKNDKKHGTWRIWDELGTQRYELNYYEGTKTGIWRMWDEKGNLIDEKRY